MGLKISTLPRFSALLLAPFSYTTTTALFTMDIIEDIDLFELIPTIILGVTNDTRK